MADDYDFEEENQEAIEEEKRQQNDAAQTIQKYWRSKQTGQNIEGEFTEEDELIKEEQRRKELIEDYIRELHNRDKFLKENMQMQRTLNKVFQEKKQSDQDKPQEQHNAAEGENKYIHQLDQLRSKRMEVEQLKESNRKDHEEVKKRMDTHEAKAGDFDDSFRALKRKAAEQSVFTRNNKQLKDIKGMMKKLDELEMKDKEKSTDVRSVRINYIRMRNRQKKLADLLKEKEKLTDGLHLIDFEQLKIENTTLNEKIEERNEDLLKLKKKATTTIHILTHVKEKLQFIQGENLALRKQLEALDATLDEHRSQMTAVKRDRDLFVSENVKMREKMPMIGSEDLLMDYEVRKKQIENLRIEVVEKTNRHHELMQWITKWQPVVQQRQASLRKARTP